MGNDLSFNIIALNRASQTIITIAEQLDRLADRLERLDRKDVSVNVNVKTDDSLKLLDSFSNRFKLIATGIAAASPAIGAAIIGGIGAGFVGVAALAQKSNKDVQQTYTNLWHNVVAETQNATDQLVPQLVGAGKSIDVEMQKLGPSISHAFSFAGPDIVALSHGVTDFAHNAMPGAEAAMQNSLPIAEAVASVMGQLGTAFSDTATSISQHSVQFGTDLQSFGNIANTAVGTATNVVNDLGSAWAQNAGTIDNAISNTGASVSGLAQGALPILTAALGLAATVLQDITAVLKPISPILGFLGTAALGTWAAFKLVGLATAGVKALATGVVNLGANMEVGATKAGLMIAGMKGVEVESLAAARTVTAAGAASASAAIGFGAAAEAMAGPLGIALVAGVALLTLFTSSSDNSAQAQQELKSGVDAVTSALERSHGATTIAVEDTVKGLPAYKDAAKLAGQLGISQEELVHAITQGGAALDNLRTKIQSGVAGMDKSTTAGAQYIDTIQRMMTALDVLANQFGIGTKAATDNAAASEEVARTTLALPDFQYAVARSATALGISLDDVWRGYIGVVVSGSSASKSAQDVAIAFEKSALTIAAAQRSLTDHFVSADKAVVQATRSVADASHSYEQSSRAIADAQHSVANAERAVADAHRNVETAQKAVTRAEQQETAALVSLNAAREKAVEDLKALHLQLEDQVVSEESARVRLFESAQTAAGAGVTPQNAKDIAAQTVTAANIGQVKAAIDLLSAQNSLNDALNSGEKLRKDVTAADNAGIEGAPGVVSAQQAVASAHDQVASALAGVTSAQQQETDAAYAAQQAHRQLGDAIYQNKRAADQLALANQALKDAQDAASRTFNISTKAGQENLTLLLSLWDAISKTGLPQQQLFNTMIDDTATAFGISKQAAQDYLTQLGLIPPDFKYSVTAVGSVDFTGLVNELANGDMQFVGGKVFRGLASGGPVVGVGGPRDDANLIWASSGEYMQPADAVSHYGVGFMNAIRSKKLHVVGSDGAAIQGYATGGSIGLLGANTQVAAIGTQYQSLVTALDVMGFPHPDGLPKYVPPVFGPIGSGAFTSYAAGAGVAQWATAILQALAQLGQSADWLATVERRMNQESGGNPTVVNKWDSNWLRGTPSVGLMQVIGPTFRAYAGPYAGTGPYEYGVSVNPLANIFAGLNYALHRYGSLSALNRPGGYDHGGLVQPGWTPVWNGTGKPEMMRTATQEDALLQAIRDKPAVVNKTMNVELHVANAPTDVMMQLHRAEMLGVW